MIYRFIITFTLIYNSVALCSMQVNDDAHTYTYSFKMYATSPTSKPLCCPYLCDPAVLVLSLNNQQTKAYIEQQTYFYVAGFNNRQPFYEPQMVDEENYRAPLVVSSEKIGSPERSTLEKIFPQAITCLDRAKNGAKGSFKYQKKDGYHELNFNEGDL